MLLHAMLMDITNGVGAYIVFFKALKGNILSFISISLILYKVMEVLGGVHLGQGANPTQGTNAHTTENLGIPISLLCRGNPPRET